MTKATYKDTDEANMLPLVYEQRINREQTNRAYDLAISNAETIETAYIAHEWLSEKFYRRNGNKLNSEARALLRDLGWDGDNEDDTLLEVKDRMIKTPLEVTVLGEKVNDRWDVTGAIFLLHTGGPAVRIVASNHDGYETVSNTTLECQDWFTQWEPVTVTDQQQAALEWFVSLFYIGEE